MACIHSFGRKHKDNMSRLHFISTNQWPFLDMARINCFGSFSTTTIPPRAEITDVIWAQFIFTHQKLWKGMNYNSSADYKVWNTQGTCLAGAERTSKLPRNIFWMKSSTNFLNNSWIDFGLSKIKPENLEEGSHLRFKKMPVVSCHDAKKNDK